MLSQSAELDSAAMAGPIQAGGHYATPTPPRHRKRLITHQVGVWLTADGGVRGLSVVMGRMSVRLTVVMGQGTGTARDS